MIEDLGKNNRVICPDGFTLNGKITGSNNVITIGNAPRKSSATVRINGDNNELSIGENTALANPYIYIGNHIAKADHTSIKIGSSVSTEPNCAFYVYNSDNKLHIGDDCMLSSNIVLRCGESPHLIFDAATGAYLDTSEGVFIGNHVWIGERVYITKNVTIPNECIVAACSVVTKRFDVPHSVLAGNPAKIAKRGVKWARNQSTLQPSSPEAISLRQHKANSVQTHAKAKAVEHLATLEHLTEEIERADAAPSSYLSTASILRELGNLDKAISALAAGIRRFPEEQALQDLLDDMRSQADVPTKYTFSSEGIKFYIDSPVGTVRRGNAEVLLKGWVRREPGTDLSISLVRLDGTTVEIPITVRNDVKRFFQSRHSEEVDSECGFSIHANLSTASHLSVALGADVHHILIKPKKTMQVIEGKDGWLFRANDSNRSVDLFTGTLTMQEQQRMAWTKFLEDVNRLQQGRLPVYVISPSKEAVHPHLHPFPAGPEHIGSKVAGIIREGGLDCVYPVEKLREQDGSYYETDTHWSDQGALVALQEAVSLLGYSNDITSLFDFEEKKVLGDLGAKLTPHRFSQRAIAIPRKGVGSVDTFASRKTLTGEFFISKNSDPVINKTLVIFGGSSSINLFNLSKHVFRSVFRANTPLQMPALDLCDALSADHMILQTNERYLLRAPEVSKLPGSKLGEAIAAEYAEEDTASTDPLSNFLQRHWG